MIAELWRLKGPPSGAPYSYRKEKETHELIFLGLAYSAYEMKTFLCLFERPLKIQKNGVFLFEISIFVLEILTFFYYAN